MKQIKINWKKAQSILEVFIGCLIMLFLAYFFVVSQVKGIENKYLKSENIRLSTSIDAYGTHYQNMIKIKDSLR